MELDNEELVPVKQEDGTCDLIRIKRERGANDILDVDAIVPDYNGQGVDIFKSFPEIPITREHKRSKRLRCVCMEDAALTHIKMLLKRIDASASAICVTNTSEFILQIKNEFKNEMPITPEEFDSRMHSLLLQIEEGRIRSNQGKKKKSGNAGQIQKMFSTLKQIKKTLRSLSKLSSDTIGRFNRLAERQVVINNKLTQIRVKKSEGSALRTTEWANWSFLDEKPSKKK